jgi:hypothetical protein
MAPKNPDLHLALSREPLEVDGSSVKQRDAA